MSDRVNSCTEGIWFWDNPILVEGKTHRLLLVDVEGKDSLDRDATQD